MSLFVIILMSIYIVCLNCICLFITIFYFVLVLLFNCGTFQYDVCLSFYKIADTQKEAFIGDVVLFYNMFTFPSFFLS